MERQNISNWYIESRPFQLTDVTNNLKKWFVDARKGIKETQDCIQQELNNIIYEKYRELNKDVMINRKHIQKLLQEFINDHITKNHLYYIKKLTVTMNFKHGAEECKLDFVYNELDLFTEHIVRSRQCFLYDWSTSNAYLNNFIRDSVISVHKNYLLSIWSFITLLYLRNPATMYSALTTNVTGDLLDDVIRNSVALLGESIAEHWLALDVELKFLEAYPNTICMRGYEYKENDCIIINLI